MSELPVCACHGIQLAFPGDECGICVAEHTGPNQPRFTDEEVVVRFARVSSVDQLQSWVGKLRKRYRRSALQNMRLRVFSAELTARAEK